MHSHKSHPDKALQAIRFHQCPYCAAPATLIANVEETRLYLDANASRQYYCTSCNSVFSVNAQGQTCNKRPHGIPNDTQEQWISFISF
jgi:transposase-like protein